MSSLESTRTVEDTIERRFRIGSVAKMTSIPTATLRTWERRYEVVKPSRSEAGARMYTLEDVTRLKLLREATELGKRIGDVADMSNDTLREFVAKVRPTPEPDEEEPREPPALLLNTPVRVAVIAQSLPEQLATAEVPSDIELVTISHSLRALCDRQTHVDVDVILVELELLGADPEEAMQTCRDTLAPAGIVVMFDFAKASTLRAIMATGARLVQTPARLPVLHQQIRDLAQLKRIEREQQRSHLSLLQSPDEATRAPKRSFRDDQLARLQEMTSDVECECPNHLASLVSGLLAFEQYSRSCKSQNPGDAELHQRLSVETGRARKIIEELLREVCIQDGIDF